MNDRKRLGKLAALTKLHLGHFQRELARLKDEESEVQTTLDRLNLAYTERATNRMRNADPALVAGADTRWQVWVEQQREGYNLDIAALRIQITAAESQLRTALMRNDVVKGMADQAHQDRKTSRSKAEDYES